METKSDLTAADLARLREAGISVAEIERQLRLFGNPPAHANIDRPCRVGDGIRVLDSSERAESLRCFAEARAAGRVRKFVPASGAASRMFQSLLSLRAGEAVRRADLRSRAERGEKAAREVLTFCDGLRRFAFFPELAEVLARRGRNIDELAAEGRFEEIIDVLLGPDGLDYAQRPKGLLAFHRYADEVRTAFEEHLVEAAEYVADSSGLCRLHFTVSPEHEPGFRELLARTCGRYESRFAVRYDVGFSHQKPATDTIAVDLDNRPFRDAGGRLVLRPGGHGALIENLADLGGDLVHLQNIDNVAPDPLRAPVTEWKQVLIGHLAAVQKRLFAHVEALERPGGPSASDLDAAAEFAAALFGADARDAESLRAHLDRPLRVCGVVPNTGEPGGGPFWVTGRDGSTSLQIVESAQVDESAPEQRERFRSASHFNPVSLVCALRDRRDNPYDLLRFIDPEAVFIARKSKDGRDLKALERPGLWNGAMAFWNTIFVEIPEICFTPVKTVNDLLRPEHQVGT